MNNLTQLQQTIEDLKTLAQLQTGEGLIDKDLAKDLMKSFEMACRCLEIGNNITK
jgi:hypothetical protein